MKFHGTKCSEWCVFFNALKIGGTEDTAQLIQYLLNTWFKYLCSESWNVLKFGMFKELH